jgi:hypothetical protein
MRRNAFRTSSNLMQGQQSCERPKSTPPRIIDYVAA